jgi:tetratricopeptide (TPR) repeat protein
MNRKFLSNSAAALLFIILTNGIAFAQDEKALTREGNNYFKKEKFDEAEISYRKALEKKKDMPEAAFNLGDAVYEQKRYEEAAKQFELSAKTTADNKIKAKALHNLGNSYLSQQKFKEAANAFKSSLKLNPKDEDTRYNLAYANAMLQQQQQNQQNQNNKDQQKEQDKKENQQNQPNKQDDKNDQQKNNPNQQQANNNNEPKQQGQQPKLNKQDAEKLLQALQNEEQKANQKMQKANAVPVKIKVEKDW